MNYVTRVEKDTLHFNDGFSLFSDHDQDCCEWHWLSFEDLELSDFEGLEFDLSGDFFNRVPDYGIELVPASGWPVRVPGYGSNNGYYSSNLSLILEKDGAPVRRFDISECQGDQDSFRSHLSL